MKRTSRILAMILALCLALSLGALAADAAPAAAATAAPAAATDDSAVRDAYHEYLHQWLQAEDAVNDNMDETIVENEFMPLILADDYTTFPADMLFNGMLNNGCPMTYEEFAAQYTPDAAAAAPASGESVEDAYHEYLHQFLLDELAVNSNMTEDQIENEFMPLILADDYTTFPADMLFNGMLNNGSAMTFEEFSAQYTPAAAPSGEASAEADSGLLPIYEENGQKYIKLSDLMGLLKGLIG